MANLTQTSSISRLVIKWGIVFIVTLMVGRTTISGLIKWYKNTHPVIVPPTIGFGIIPAVKFPDIELPKLKFRLETITGTLPELATQADVMKMSADRPNLLAMERSITEVGSLGFKEKPEKVTDLSYRWRLMTPIPASLVMNIYDGRFVWNTDWKVDPNFLVKKSLPSKNQAIKEAQDLAKKVTSNEVDLSAATAVVSYLKGVGGEFQPTTSLSDADFVQVDLFRDLHNQQYKFVTSTPDQGIVRVILSGNQRSGRVIQMIYNYFPIDYTAIETYPLKTTAQAWQELNDGKGYVASVDKSMTEVVVRRVELVYFDSFEPQAYAQPVYMFTGDGNFVGYVQAVKDPKESLSN